MTSTSAESLVVGREIELAHVTGFLTSNGGPRGLAIVGEAGIGKTTVWEAGWAATRAAGDCVLAARASEPELRMSFVALADLLAEVDLDAVPGVPVPQRRALDVALLRAEPQEARPEEWAVAAGFTTVLRCLAEQRSVVVAVDDVPWLDRASHDALAFAARRLSRHSVRFLLTRRPGEPSALELALAQGGLGKLELRALSLGAIRTLLSRRLQLRPPRRTLLRLLELSHGSPLIALELGRMLLERGLPEAGQDLPLPELVENLFGQRIAGLDTRVRRGLLAVAVAGGLDRTEVTRLVGRRALQDAVGVGILVTDGNRLRAAHPLLAAAVRRSASPDERRQIHLGLAKITDDEIRQARYLGLAALHPEAELAQQLTEAASAARARGAVDDAVELAEQALRLTPAGDTSHGRRLLALGDCLLAAGELSRVTELLEPRLATLDPGVERAHAHLLLGDPSPSASEHLHHLDRVLEETDDPSLRVAALARMAEVVALYSVERVPEAEAWASEAVNMGARAGASSLERARHALAWVQALRGRPLGDLGESPDESMGDDPRRGGQLVDRPLAVQLGFRGEIDRAHAVLAELLTAADERGAAYEQHLIHLHLCELTLRRGDCVVAAELLADGDWQGLTDSTRLRCEALLAVLQGDPASLEKANLAIAAAGEHVWQLLEARRAAGSALLFLGQPGPAVEQLRSVWEHTEREGVTDPGAFPVAPDLVEALAEVGQVDDALAVTARLTTLASEQEHPWGLASARRCRALVSLAAGNDVETAEAELEEAAATYCRLGLRFDAGRSMLILGRSRRRRRKWAAARVTLNDAVVIFTELGAVGWAERAKAELSRVGGRRAAPAGSLSSMERQVAELVQLGRSNKAIARELHVTVSTVEKHLSHVYAKLGVRSRGELAHRLLSES